MLENCNYMYMIETNRSNHQQKALKLYKHLKTLNKSELTLDEELLIENLEVALHLW
jgi:hypothetical protein